MIPLRTLVQAVEDRGILSYLPDSTLTGSDLKEFAANAKYEASLLNEPDEWLIFQDVLFKADFAKAFLGLAPKLDLNGTETVLELGASHGWASSIVKKRHPECYVVASDLIADTMRHAEQWERLLGCSLNEKWALNCRDLPFADEQFDRIFTFASFHHFAIEGNFAPALAEMKRVLKPNGRIVLLYEPSAPPYLYRLAFARVNRKREVEGVDEDVIVPSKIRAISKALNLKCEVEAWPSSCNRSSVGSTLYYFVLSKLGRLCSLFVCTVNVILEKALGENG